MVNIILILKSVVKFILNAVSLQISIGPLQLSLNMGHSALVFLI